MAVRTRHFRASSIIGWIEVHDGGRTGHLASIVRLTNAGADGVERADPHGLAVRRLR